MRKGRAQRKTAETEIVVEVNLDGKGTAVVKTGVLFLDHLITSLATRTLIDVKAEINGDLAHHIVEDVAITLGEALDQALGDRRSIFRFGQALIPMDEALALASVDLVRRPYSAIRLQLKGERIEDAAVEDIRHFIRSLILSMKATCHLRVLYGKNDHHKVESAFKALAVSLRRASTKDERRGEAASSKGVM